MIAEVIFLLIALKLFLQVLDAYGSEIVTKNFLCLLSVCLCYLTSLILVYAEVYRLILPNFGMRLYLGSTYVIPYRFKTMFFFLSCFVTFLTCNFLPNSQNFHFCSRVIIRFRLVFACKFVYLVGNGCRKRV